MTIRVCSSLHSHARERTMTVREALLVLADGTDVRGRG